MAASTCLIDERYNGEIILNLSCSYWRKLHICLHIHLHQDGLAAGNVFLAISALDSWRDWGDGRVCLALATGHRKDAAFHGLYVQGDKLDFCAADFSIAIW